MTSLFIALPAFGYVVTAPTTASLVELAGKLGLNGIKCAVSVIAFPDIVEARNTLFTAWYDQGKYSHLLFVDADMDFPARLVLDMLTLNQPLVGCIYPKKCTPVEFVGLNIGPIHANGFARVDGVGCGVMLIRRDCAEALVKEHPDVTARQHITQHPMRSILEGFRITRLLTPFDRVVGLSEDLSFCYRHRKLGGQVWAATHHTIGHMGMNHWRARYGDERVD